MQTLQNGIKVPTNSDPYKLTDDLAQMGLSSNVIIPVQTKADRDGLADKFPGMTVSRLDLPGAPLETWDGNNWQGQVWTPYTPVWGGWANLGAGFQSTGSWIMLAPKLCEVRAKLKAGPGAAMGNGQLALTLPFTSASDQATLGEAEWLQTGVFGGLQKVILSNPPNNIQASILSWPGGASQAVTPGVGGFGYGTTTEVHATIKYRIA
ncbi:hypothetical protein HWD94_03955 [Pseudarthrobacter equi]|uniref:hypothetical protein n=1 Tax=Pseudarthrobacter equi TaxID=728066 RepID=UPI0021BE860A|nr:hypothetical protein [Pseudarthrobacter equi]MCT9624277.1 hypothetical protein [Pseudarthrobacter equi]